MEEDNVENLEEEYVTEEDVRDERSDEDVIDLTEEEGEETSGGAGAKYIERYVSKKTKLKTVYIALKPITLQYVGYQSPTSEDKIYTAELGKRAGYCTIKKKAGQRGIAKATVVYSTTNKQIYRYNITINFLEF